MAQQSVADESLLYGTEERRQQLYGDNSSGSANAHVEQLQQAPAPPMQPHPSLRAGVDHWTTMNAGVQNSDGSQSADMGFNILNNQYIGNAPMSATGPMMGDNTAVSMDWQPTPPAPMGVGEYVGPLVQPGLSGNNVGPLAQPGLGGNGGMVRTNFAGVYAAPQQRVNVGTGEPMWSQPIRSTLLDDVNPNGGMPPGLTYLSQQSFVVSNTLRLQWFFFPSYPPKM